MKNSDEWNIFPALKFLVSKWRIFISAICLVLIFSVIVFHFIVPKKYEAVCVITPVAFDPTATSKFTPVGYKIPFEEETQLMLEVLASNTMKSALTDKKPAIHLSNIYFGRTANYQVFIKVHDKTQGKASEIANFIAEQYNIIAQQDSTNTLPSSIIVNKPEAGYESVANPSKIKIHTSVILLTTIIISVILLVKRKQENNE